MIHNFISLVAFLNFIMASILKLLKDNLVLINYKVCNGKINDSISKNNNTLRTKMTLLLVGILNKHHRIMYETAVPIFHDPKGLHKWNISIKA